MPRGKLSESEESYRICTHSFLFSTHPLAICSSIVFLLLSSLFLITFLTFPHSFPHFSSEPVCDGTQNVKRYRYRYFFPVPNIFDTDTGTFFGTKFFRYRFRDFFPIPNFTDTGSETFFRYQIYPIPVPIPPEKKKIPGTDTYTIPVPIKTI